MQNQTIYQIIYSFKVALGNESYIDELVFIED